MTDLIDLAETLRINAIRDSILNALTERKSNRSRNRKAGKKGWAGYRKRALARDPIWAGRGVA